MISRLTSPLYIIILFFLFSSCVEEEDSLKVVITGDVMFLSSENVRLQGRFLNSSDETASDHGFLVSIDENFSDPFQISLGPKSLSGFYFGEYNELQSNTNYYYKGFATFEEGIVEGEVKTFTTLSPKLVSFTPRIADEGERIEIRGENFSNESQVFIGENEAEILDVVFESKLFVRVPPKSASANSEFATITVKNSGVELQFEEQFEYLTGQWQQVGTLNVEIPPKAIDFNDSGSYIIGSGNKGGSLSNEFWAFDKNTLEWSVTTDYNIPNSFSRISEDCGEYFIGSTPAPSGPILELWTYENPEFTFQGYLEESTLNNLCLVYNNKLFLIGGQKFNDDSELETLRKLFTFDLSTKAWDEPGFNPVKVTKKVPHFIYNNKAYMVSEDGYLWSLSAGNNWEQLVPIPASILEIGIAEVIDDTAYFVSSGGGTYSLDLINFTWKRKKALTSGSTEIAGHYVHNGKLYLVRNDSFSNSLKVWEFNPGTI
ncbi:MAG: IPT/TIG domain-containing protein [Fulvivirga sp.]|nr:IPT/TIG domain-containing protein [Fulvivirga sp.]